MLSGWPLAAAAAAPGLKPSLYYGPLGELFYRHPSPSLGERGLLKNSVSEGLLEEYTSFRHKRITVDSTGVVVYTPRAAGFATGSSVVMPLEEFIHMGYEYESRRVWRERVRQTWRENRVRQGRRKGHRLEFKLPFPRTPRPLQKILGKEPPTLKMSGERTITIAGKSEWTEGEVQTLSGRPSRFPSLSMEQESKFTIEGKVGELINIRINQDTESLGSAFNSGVGNQLDNQIRFDYKGDEDAIFQEIQAGNTTLVLPNTRFVGLRQQNKGLFGIRTKGKVGPIGFTAIASQEESKSNRQSFKGGTRVDTLKLRDWQYLRNTYFFLDNIYRERLKDFRQVADPNSLQDFNPDDAIDERSLLVYINDFNSNNDAEQQAKPGVARFDLNGPRDERSGYVERGTWEELDRDNDYTLVPELGYIIMRRSVPERHALAVIYRTVGGQRFGDKDVAPGDSLQLKLIKPRDARPDFPTWNLEWKNVYQVASQGAGKKFDRNQIDIQVLEEVRGQEPQSSQGGRSFLQIVGLDVEGRDPGTPPDRLIDPNYVGLDEFRGVLIFPDLKPFDPQNARYAGLENKVPEIYENQQQRDLVEASRYLIQVVSSTGQQRISLNQLGVDPQSVSVMLNGERLEPGTDFNVSFTGEVQFLRDEIAQKVADPGADLEITFETRDLLGLGSQKKTLLGLRGEYEFWDGNGVLSSTMIYNNERSSERQVRVGNEPARTLIWDLDLDASFEAPALTRLVDALPLVKTAVKSEVQVEAEVAQSRPNLNTRGEGFIDNFEGSERPDLLSVIRTRWTPASVPVGTAYSEDDRGELIWFNPFNRVRRTEIWPQQADQIEAQADQTDVLVLELSPRGEALESWGGVMTAFTGGVRDFSLSKFLEIWLQGDEGVLNIDLGEIDEDYVANGLLDTEDQPFPGRSTGDGLVSREEDVGIDGRDDRGELNFSLDQAGVDTTGLALEDKKREFARLFPGRNPEDPQGDNWSFNRLRNEYDHINGTQGNKGDQEASDRPDTEDLNNDGNLNTRNDYYHYTIDLAHDAHVPGTESTPEDPKGGWRLFRLPLFAENVERVGVPDSSRTEYARLVLTGSPGAGGEPLRVRIAQIEIIGNEWQENPISLLEEEGPPVREDENFNITVVGTDENLSYEPPPKIKIRRNSRTRTREREQSLVLVYDHLDAGHQASATKVLTRNANYTKYTRLQMFVHGDDLNTEYARGDSSDLELFLRFGADSTNYYEFATRVLPGWDERNEVDVDLVLMSQLKGRLLAAPVDSLGRRIVVLDTLVVDKGVRRGEPAVYRVRGNPSLQQVRQLTLGLRNRGALQAYSGQVFADELLLDQARNDPGLASFARVRAQMADLFNVDAQVIRQSENFRTLNSTGRTASDLTTNLQTTANMQKFFPGSWKLSVPVKFRFDRRLSLPRFAPNSDVELTNRQKDEQRTQNTTTSYEVSFSKRPGNNGIARWTVDQVNLRWSDTSQRGFDPVQPLNRRHIQSLSFNYKMPLPSPTVPAFGWLPGFMPRKLREMRLRYLPSNFNYALSVNRTRASSLRRTDADTTFQEDFTLRETYTAKAIPLPALSADYTLQVERDLRKKYNLRRLSFGTEAGRNQKADVKLNLRFFRWLDQRYTFQANYEEIQDPRRRRTQVVVDPQTELPVRTRDIITRNDLSAQFNLGLPTLLRSIGKPADIRRRDPNRSRVGARREKEQSGKGPQPAQKPFFVRRFLYFSGSFIEPVNFRWRRNTTGRNFNLTRRPPLLFQLGIKKDLKVRQVAVGLTQQDQFGRSENYNLDSGLKLPLGFSVKSNYKERTERRSGSTQRRLRVKNDRTFPSVRVAWTRADHLPLMRRFINSAQVNLTFEAAKTREGEGGVSRRELISKGRSNEFTASWSGKWHAGPQTKIEVRRSSSSDTDFELVNDTDTLAETLPPVRGTGSRQVTKTTFDVRYKLRPTANLPILGKLRSDVDLRFEVNLDSETRSSGIGDAVRAPIARTSRWRAALTANYKFSDNFRGNGIIRAENNRNKLTQKTRKTREVRLSGTLFFR